MKKALLAIMISFSILATGAAVYGYEIEWWYVQHRVYENGTARNSAHFGIFDDAGNAVERDVIRSIRLFDPDGDEVAVETGFGGIYETLYGNYNPYDGKWEYEDDFFEESYYWVNFYEPLKQGTYRFEIIDSDGMVYEISKDYFGSGEDLPIISSDSFQFFMDPSGNFVGTWDIPDDTLNETSTSVRAWIDVYSGQNFIAEIYVRVPTHLGRLFVPSDVFQRAAAKGDSLRFGVQLRTNDGFKRAYSNSIPIDPDDLPLPPSACFGLEVTYHTDTVNVTKPGWVRVFGTVTNKCDEALCAMILANGQKMFTCGANQGQYSLEVPLDRNGKITLYGFCSGLLPFEAEITP